MTYDIKALRDLEKRLAEAKGPDRVQDFWIAVELGPSPLKSDTGTEARPNWVNDSGQEFDLWGAEGRYGFIGHHVVPVVTASLDAAVALVERVLPGFHWHVETMAKPHTQWIAEMYDHEAERPRGVKQGHSKATPALALCLACVRALIAQEEAA